MDLLTPYILEGNNSYPAMIICPGGAYSTRAYHEGEPVALWLNRIGISAFVLNYRVSPHQHPAPLEDAQTAIRLVRANASEWNVDSKRVGIMGFSAGGHLASTVGTHFDLGNPHSNDSILKQSSRPDLMVLGYPVITMSDEFTSTGSREALLGERQTDPDLLNLLSNEKQITADTPPAFLWHTVEDNGVPLENSLLFANGLRKHKIPFALHLFESGMHGIGLAEDHLEAQHWPVLCEEWLKKRQFITTNPQWGSFSTLGDMLSDEKARAILDRYLPELVQSPYLDYTKGFTLKMLSSFPHSPISKEILQSIHADLRLLCEEELKKNGVNWMHELWNGTIKTPYLQFYAVFTITKDKSGVVQLAVETEPMNLNLSFEQVRLNENVLSAKGIDPSGQSYDIELTFQHQNCTGSISLPYMGTVQFSGEKGRGASLNEKLQQYGEASVQENRYWKGKWIWDVRQPEEQANTEHHLVYFRRSFHIDESISPKLMIDISADSRYRLYVNGKSVSIGPCKGDMHTTYYESVDVSEHLITGNNVLSVKVLRYPAMEPFKIGEGGPISVWRSQSAGLLVEASLRDETGTELMSLHSDANWRTYRHLGYRHVPKQLIRWMGGVEEVEGKDAPQGWEFPEYDDSTWEHAVPFAETHGFAGILSPWNLLPRPIPFMYEEEKQFIEVTKAAGVGVEETEQFLQNTLDNTSSLVIPSRHKIQVDLDAGKLTTGYLNIRMRNGRDAKVRLMAAECYESHESTEIQRKKGDREDSTGQLMGEFDTYIVAGQVNDTVTDEIYEPFWFRTFRYVRLEIETEDAPLELMQLSYRESRYPLEVKAKFESSDQELNKIWDLSVRTLQLCMHETYEDCPYYEQLQYAMDSRLMMLFTYNVSGDDRMARRTIEDFYRSRQPSGLLQARFPSVEPQVIPSFSLYWVDMISEHFEFNGDLQLVEQYRPAIIELMDWFHTRLTDDGIVGVTSNRYWTYFDWVDAWPLGAPPESVDRPMFLLSFMYAAALRKSATLLHATGWSQAASTMESRAEQVCNALRKLAWSEERQLFRDMPGLEIYSQHTQIISILAGAIEGEEARRLMERTLEEQIHRVTLPFSYLMIQALKKVGLQHKIFGLWDRWRVFASQGLTTLPEMEVNPRSDCHAWSAVPLAEFPATILGVTPADPGATTIRIEPHIGKLDWAKGSVATKQGLIEIEWHIEEHQFLLKAKLPVGTSAIVKLPDGTEHSFHGAETFTCII